MGRRVIGVMLITALLLGAAPGVLNAETAHNARIDFIVSSIVPSAVDASKILVVVKNIGTVRFRRNIEVELWFDDESLGRQRVEEDLRLGVSVYAEFLRPDRLPDGMHTLTAEIDPDNEVREQSETNNRKAITVWIDGSKGPMAKSARRNRKGR